MGLNLTLFDKILRIILSAIIFGLFFYLSMKATSKYLKEPVSTNIYRTVGDGLDELGTLHFPEISICPNNIVEKTQCLKDCSNGNVSYGDVIIDCIRHYENFDIVNCLSEMRYE